MRPRICSQLSILLLSCLLLTACTAAVPEEENAPVPDNPAVTEPAPISEPMEDTAMPAHALTLSEATAEIAVLVGGADAGSADAGCLQAPRGIPV